MSRVGATLCLFLLVLQGWPTACPAEQTSAEALGAPAAATVPAAETPSATDLETPPAVRWEETPPAPALAPVRERADAREGPPAGPSYLLERIEIVGNKVTMRTVILRAVEIRPGEIFSATDPRLEHTRYRLLSSGLFHRVDLSLKRGSARGAAILVIAVKERNTKVVQDLVIGVSEITPYFAADVGERSLLGSGMNLSTALVVSSDQWGYRLRFGDNHFADSDFRLNVEGLYSHARDFFGHKDICFVSSCADQPGDGRTGYANYASMRYDRAGMRFGTGYTLFGDNHFYIDYRIEEISAHVPPAGSHVAYNTRQPIIFGHLLPGHSALSSIFLGVVRDTRDSQILPASGHRTSFEVELSNEVIGSSYDFSKFTLAHDTYFPLGRGHAIKLGLFLGLIMGDAPFYNQFFIGDFTSFVPSRVLDLNFSYLQPSLLDTTIAEMRYEDMAFSVELEYHIPFYRGQKVIYGINGFIGLGVFALASRDDLRVNPKGYDDAQIIPMDLTADLGVRIDTGIGMFVISLANVLRLIPLVGREGAE